MSVRGRSAPERLSRPTLRVTWAPPFGAAGMLCRHCRHWLTQAPGGPQGTRPAGRPAAPQAAGSALSWEKPSRCTRWGCQPHCCLSVASSCCSAATAAARLHSRRSSPGRPCPHVAAVTDGGESVGRWRCRATWCSFRQAGTQSAGPPGRQPTHGPTQPPTQPAGQPPAHPPPPG